METHLTLTNITISVIVSRFWT